MATEHYSDVTASLHKMASLSPQSIKGSRLKRSMRATPARWLERRSGSIGKGTSPKAVGSASARDAKIIARIGVFLAAFGAFDTLSRPRNGDGPTVDLDRDLVAAMDAVDVFRLHAICRDWSMRLFRPSAALIVPEDLKRSE